MIQSPIIEVSKFLKNVGINIRPNNEWLKSCVQCFLEETPSIDLASLKSSVQEQWLLADLREVKAPSLPEQCHTNGNIILRDKYTVQINYVVNTAESFYKQMLKIRRPDAETNLSVDIEKEEKEGNESKSILNRNLKFELTDGFNTVVAFEDKPILSVVEPVVPGVKAILIGPIECRKGVLFLREGSIKLLGGEVDTLLIPNAVENVLARALHLPETSNPFKHMAKGVLDEKLDLMEDGNDDAFLQIPEEIESSSHNENSSCMIISPHRSIITIDDDDDETFALMAAQTASLAEEVVLNPLSFSTPKSNVTAKKKQSDLGSYLSKATSSNKSASAETNIIQTEKVVVSTFKSKPATSKNNGNIGSWAAENLEVVKSTIQPSRMYNMDLPRSLSHEDKIIVDVMKDNPLVEIPESIMDSPNRRVSHSSQQNVENLSKPINKPLSSRASHQSLTSTETTSESIVYSSDVSEKSTCPPEPFPPTSFPSERSVFIEVIRTSRLAMRNGKWCLSAVVKAQDQELDVDFAPETLDEIMEVKAEVINARKQSIVHNVTEKEKLNQFLIERQKKIKKLACPVRLHFPSYISRAVVVEAFLQ